MYPTMIAQCVADGRIRVELIQPYDDGVDPATRRAYHKWYRARRAAWLRAAAKRGGGVAVYNAATTGF